MTVHEYPCGEFLDVHCFLQSCQLLLEFASFYFAVTSDMRWKLRLLNSF
jgi:hypothetical protein